MNTRTSSQIKRFEIGDFIRSCDYYAILHGSGYGMQLDQYAAFHISFGARTMDVCLYDKVKIKWGFEDIKTMSIVKYPFQKEDNEWAELEWLWIRLTCFPKWSIKRNPESKSKGSWGKEEQSNFPPSVGRTIFNNEKNVLPNAPTHNAKNILIAFHQRRDFWLKYITYINQHGMLENYDTSMVSSIPRTVVLMPFEEEDWSVSNTLCQNCDDQKTAGKVFCLNCKSYYCRTCDIVLHKSRRNSSHKRRTICSFPEDLVYSRETIEGCDCKRLSQCKCSSSFIFCGELCSCQGVNLYQYGLDQEDLADCAEPLKTKYLPLRMQEKKGKGKRPNDPFSDGFVTAKDTARRTKKQTRAEDDDDDLEYFY